MADDNTLDTAGPVGRDLADALAGKVRDAIAGFPAPDRQRAAVARIVANSLYDFADEAEANDG